MDCCPAFGAWFRSSTTVRVGLRTDGTRNTCANCSAEEAGCGGVLSIRAEPDVCRLLRWMGRAVGGLRTSELAFDRSGGGRGAWHSSFARGDEEPTLRQMFGAEYEEYCRNVRRWVPRMRAWNK